MAYTDATFQNFCDAPPPPELAGRSSTGIVVTGRCTTIGTVNASEFVLTATVSITLILPLGFKAFTVATICLIIGGLIIGGLLAAPLGAVIAKRIAAKRLMAMVGVLLTATSLFSLDKVLA